MGIAVILLSYNRPTLVQKAIESVLNQTYEDFKLYIVDNNSRREVQDMLELWQNIYPDKIVLHFFDTKEEDRMKKCWISIMVNWGIKNSTEEYICMLTDDMWYDKNRLERIAKHLGKHPSKVVYGTQITQKADGEVVRIRPALDVLLPNNKGLAGEQLVFHRSLIDEIGYWNESSTVNTCMDREFQLRIPYKRIPVKGAINYELEHYKRWTKLMIKGGPAKKELIDGSLME